VRLIVADRMQSIPEMAGQSNRLRREPAGAYFYE